MIECYVDDITVKSRDKNNHLCDLKIMFDIMRAYQLKITQQSLSWVFQVASSWDSLSHEKESILIQTRLKLFRACNHLRISRNLGVCKEGWPISGFIANLSGRCQLFTQLIKKGVSFVWDKACQEAFEDIKEYLTKPPVLVAPTLRKSFLFYVRAMDHSLGALLAQKNDKGHEQAIYYLSRTLIGAESR